MGGNENMLALVPGAAAVEGAAGLAEVTAPMPEKRLLPVGVDVDDG